MFTPLSSPNPTSPTTPLLGQKTKDTLKKGISSLSSLFQSIPSRIDLSKPLTAKGIGNTKLSPSMAFPVSDEAKTGLVARSEADAALRTPQTPGASLMAAPGSILASQREKGALLAQAARPSEKRPEVRGVLEGEMMNLAGGVGEVGAAGARKVIQKTAPKVAEAAAPAFQGFKDLTTKTLEKLKGRSTVSRQFIEDLTNAPDLKQSERDVIRKVLGSQPDKVAVKDFAEKVQDELLPLKTNSSDLYKPDEKTWNNPDSMVEEGGFTPKYEAISLPKEVRGKVANYKENIYESPIATSAGDTHFNYTTKNYFGHTRVEDMADDQTRRVIEVQSDLYQKGGLDRELQKDFMELSRGGRLAETDSRPEFEGLVKKLRAGTITDAEKARLDKLNDVVIAEEKGLIGKRTAKLSQYNDPTAHFRMIREEVKRAAADGKSKLQFPTGETAMKVEGLGGQEGVKFYTASTNPDLPAGYVAELKPETLKVGLEINQGDRMGSDWVITEVLGEGKFKAVPSDTWEAAHQVFEPGGLLNENQVAQHRRIAETAMRGRTETFDISGKVDKENPIYRFYEKEVSKYLKNKYGAKLVTDENGVTWWELDVKPEHRGPVEAFAGLPLGAAALRREPKENEEDPSKSTFAFPPRLQIR